LRWTDVESCWQGWVGEVACEFGLDFEAGQSGCLGWWLVIVGLRMPVDLFYWSKSPFQGRWEQ
jgi:hypothetical protein